MKRGNSAKTWFEWNKHGLRPDAQQKVLDFQAKITGKPLYAASIWFDGGAWASRLVHLPRSRVTVSKRVSGKVNIVRKHLEL